MQKQDCRKASEARYVGTYLGEKACRSGPIHPDLPG